MDSTLIVGALILLGAKVAVQYVLDWFNLRNVRANEGAIPQGFEAVMDDIHYRNPLHIHVSKLSLVFLSVFTTLESSRY